MSDFENISFGPDEEYHPFQEIVPDDREGFDAKGDWHARMEPSVDGSDAYYTNQPYVRATEIQKAIVEYAKECKRVVGREERDDLAFFLAGQNYTEDVYHIWFRMYGKGFHE